jgi:hypothetical protein
MGGNESSPKEMSLNLTREDYKFVKKTSIPNIGLVKIMENFKTNKAYIVKTM